MTQNESHKNKKFVYHMTSLGNLRSIVEHGLLSRSELHARGILADDVADPSILEGRGGLRSWVPFHFMPRNPFDYGVVKNPLHQGKRFVYLAVQRTYAENNKWSVIPRHPLAGGIPLQPMEWIEGISAIDWNQLDKKERNWDVDQPCKHSCMAEALSPSTVPFNAFEAIFCKTDEDVSEVQSLAPGRWVKMNSRMFPGGS